jgi:hypothetical protein
LVRFQYHLFLQILRDIKPLLLDENYHNQVAGHEIISLLAETVGLDTMISAMRQDIENTDENVRSATARAFAAVASALGIDPLLPFLTAGCRSKTSWQGRHTGINIVQQTAIMMGWAIPHIRDLVEIVSAAKATFCYEFKCHKLKLREDLNLTRSTALYLFGAGLTDDEESVRRMAAHTIAALTAAAIDSVPGTLLQCSKTHRGEVRFLTCEKFDNLSSTNSVANNNSCIHKLQQTLTVSICP